MMQDEPTLGPHFQTPSDTNELTPAVADSIRALVETERFAVLCTQGGGQPYGSVVAFAFAHDLMAFVFATPMATRKFRLLSECDRVALVVDNRGQFPEDMMKVEAITVTGRARQVAAGSEFEHWAPLLTARHPYLRQFVNAPSTALFRVEAVRYLHVTRFQEVRQWIPPSLG
jgi:nitroimidazol reductase NimA-like FMN-containing flavoprotein (pyridoxamine 5'-phosphate oxidase superfamily)